MNRFALPLGIILALSIGGFGAAFVVNTGVRYLVAVPDGEGIDTTGGPALAAAADSRPRVIRRDDYIRGILGRNIFNHEDIGVVLDDGTLPSGTVVTDLKVKLVATIVAEPSEYSSALILEESSGDTNGYGIGDDLMGATIMTIETKQVTIKRSDGQVEVITMEDKAVAATKRTAGRSSGGDDGGVEKSGDNNFVVDRSLVDKHLGDMESLSRMGRALLHRGPDGEFDGYRMSAIRRNTLPDKLGIRNGDIVHAVNGMPLTSVQGAMQAYSTMQSQDKFSFEITRRGQKMTMEYEVR